MYRPRRKAGCDGLGHVVAAITPSAHSQDLSRFDPSGCNAGGTTTLFVRPGYVFADLKKPANDHVCPIAQDCRVVGGPYKSKCVSRWSSAASTSRNTFLHFSHDHSCSTRRVWARSVPSGTSWMLADPHAGHFFSVLVGMSGMAPFPSLHADPRCLGDKSRRPTVVLAFLSAGCCAPARTPLGTTRLPVGPAPRLPKGPGFAPTTPTRPWRRPTS